MNPNTRASIQQEVDPSQANCALFQITNNYNHPWVFTKCLVSGFMALMFCTFSGWARDYFVANAPTGMDTGLSPSDAHGVDWLLLPGTWGSGASQIAAGDTIHIVGCVGSLKIKGGGNARSPVRFLFERDAKVSAGAANLISCVGQSYVIIDGGVNGIVENTNNGSYMGQQAATSGVVISGSANLIITNLTIRNLYVHDSSDDAKLDFTAVGGIYGNGFGDNIKIVNCNFSNICWAINLQSGEGTNLVVSGCKFADYDHGIAGLGKAYQKVLISDNFFGSTVRWDTVVNKYHHDGVHIFYGQGGGVSDVTICRNIFDGDWGINNTAHLYFEGDMTRSNPSSMKRFTIANNLFKAATNRIINNGFGCGNGPEWCWANNSFIGSGKEGSIGLSLKDNGDSLLVNNLFVGLTTFVTTGTNVVLKNNCYSARASGGNAAWIYSGTPCASYSVWKTSSGELNSGYFGASACNGNGVLTLDSPAISTGMTLGDQIRPDLFGSLRGDVWDVGAISYFRLSMPKGLGER